MSGYALVEIVKDIVAIVVPVAATLVGFSGLRTWRRQLGGTSDHELARALLRSLFRLRAAIDFFRSRFISVDEFPVDNEQAPQSRGGPRDISHAYVVRWRRVADEMTETRVQLLEAEILWQDEVRGSASALRFRVVQMADDLREHLEFLADKDLQKRFPDQALRARKVVVAQRENDDLGENLNAIFDKLEAIARRHLAR